MNNKTEDFHKKQVEELKELRDVIDETIDFHEKFIMDDDGDMRYVGDKKRGQDGDGITQIGEITIPTEDLKKFWDTLQPYQHKKQDITCSECGSVFESGKAINMVCYNSNCPIFPQVTC